MTTHFATRIPMVLAAALASALAATPAHAQTITVVNIIPATWSDDVSQDAEPNLTVNSANLQQMVATAFTWDNPAGASVSPAMTGANAPLYVSSNGGQTWSLNMIVPSAAGSQFPTFDITPRFTNASGILYAGILNASTEDLQILSTSNFLSATPMSVLLDRVKEDQPYIEAVTGYGFTFPGNDLVYIGINDFNQPSGHSSTIDLSTSAAVGPAPNGFAPHAIETRATALIPASACFGACTFPCCTNRDGPSTRPAVHEDGTVYAAFIAWRGTCCTTATNTADVVVCRDDTWGSGATPFTALTDAGPAPHDGGACNRIAIGVTLPSLSTVIGQERIGSQLSLAVDPRSSSTAYVAWNDEPSSSGPYTLHVRKSIDRGVTWSSTDLIASLTNVTNPALAVNSFGDVGLLYQRVNGTTWETHFRRSVDGGTIWSDAILASFPTSTPASQFSPYLGDYDHLLALGHNFYGIFSSSNYPDMTNFPQGVTYQRHVNWGTHTLLGNDNVTPKAVSIDPFFFSVVAGPAQNQDFYVRDWTTTASNHDQGQQPSTHAVFYATSDVWNRRGTLPGTFVNDQPASEDAGNGAGNIGDNWAFARISRNATGAAASVSAHFLVSKFGTGSAYVDNTSVDPDVNFIDPNPTTVSFAAGDTSQLTSPVHWHLNAISGNHLCLAVEIGTTPNDPFIPPSLIGQTPGWPTTDLRVVDDNNKAQRNLQLSTTPARGVGLSPTLTAIVHNAADFPRDMVVQYEAAPDVLKLLGNPVVAVRGTTANVVKDRTIVLKAMQPGENRWMSISYKAPAGKEGTVLPIFFHEMKGKLAVNGFGVGVRIASEQEVVRAAIEQDRVEFTRLAAGFQLPKALEQAERDQRMLASKQLPLAEYLADLKAHHPEQARMVLDLVAARKLGDPLNLNVAMRDLGTAVASGDPLRAAVAHTSAMNALDSYLTMLQLADGDPADILQNVRWEVRLYHALPGLRALQCSAPLLAGHDAFVHGYGVWKVTNKDYPALIKRSLGCYTQAAQLLAKKLPELPKDVEAVSAALGTASLAALQLAHRHLLLALQRLQ